MQPCLNLAKRIPVLGSGGRHGLSGGPYDRPERKLDPQALRVVAKELKEAVEIDGLGPVAASFRVTLPLIRPALLVAIIFRLLDALRVFDAIYVLTGNNEGTMSMSVYARRGLMDFQDAGGGSAAATLLFLTIAVLIGLYLTLARGTLSPEQA